MSKPSVKQIAPNNCPDCGSELRYLGSMLGDLPIDMNRTARVEVYTSYCRPCDKILSKCGVFTAQDD